MKIPDRWLPYQAMGKQISGTRFICFKVPLKEEICKKLHTDERFTPQMLLGLCPEMKIIVDLTNTSRFYDGKVFEDNGVEYKKIQTPGHVIPASGYIQQFFSAVDAFLLSSTDPDQLIGVHCTHGLNRTSYFVCCYMIHRLGMEPQDAITAFEDARGHKIERQHYVDDLLKRGMGSDDLQARMSSRRDHGTVRGRGHRTGRPNNGADKSSRNWSNPTASAYPDYQPRERIAHANRHQATTFNSRYQNPSGYQQQSNVLSYQSPGGYQQPSNVSSYQSPGGYQQPSRKQYQQPSNAQAYQSPGGYQQPSRKQYQQPSDAQAYQSPGGYQQPSSKQYQQPSSKPSSQQGRGGYKPRGERHDNTTGGRNDWREGHQESASQSSWRSNDQSKIGNAPSTYAEHRKQKAEQSQQNSRWS